MRQTAPREIRTGLNFVERLRNSTRFNFIVFFATACVALLAGVADDQVPTGTFLNACSVRMAAAYRARRLPSPRPTVQGERVIVNSTYGGLVDSPWCLAQNFGTAARRLTLGLRF
jgi:hypothetical protein